MPHVSIRPKDRRTKRWTKYETFARYEELVASDEMPDMIRKKMPSESDMEQALEVGTAANRDEEAQMRLVDEQTKSELGVRKMRSRSPGDTLDPDAYTFRTVAEVSAGRARRQSPENYHGTHRNHRR